MKFTLLLLAICLALTLVSAIKNKTEGKLINRPKFDTFGQRQRRSPYGGIKGGVKVHPLFQFSTTQKPKEPSLRKGEYMCGDRVCKLKPGVEPPGCHGVCQYPLL